MDTYTTAIWQQTDLKTEEIVQTQKKVHTTKTPIRQDIHQIAAT